eukprot:m51a1_g154 hypothetical protein (135) ;mRNA; r:501845-502311
MAAQDIAQQYPAGFYMDPEMSMGPAFAGHPPYVPFFYQPPFSPPPYGQPMMPPPFGMQPFMMPAGPFIPPVTSPSPPQRRGATALPIIDPANNEEVVVMDRTERAAAPRRTPLAIVDPKTGQPIAASPPPAKMT